MSATHHLHLSVSDDARGGFNINSQRPPVPGEENDQSQKSCVKSASDKTQKKTTAATEFSSTSPSPRDCVSGIPRRVLVHEHSAGTDSAKLKVGPAAAATKDPPLGFEPEGSVTTPSSNFRESSSSNSGGTPSYLKWAESLSYLLQDSDGVKLFKEFLDDQDQSCNALDFWFACSGLKMVAASDTDRTVGLVKLIYKKYLKGDSLRLKPDVKRKIVERLKKENVDQTIFDDAQMDVEHVMRNDMYPLFLKSDVYLQYVSAGGDSSPKTSNHSSASDGPYPASRVRKLPTLHEGEELTSEKLEDASEEDPPVYLTPRAIQATQRFREGLPPVDQSYGFSYPAPVLKPRLSNPYHVSYAPVSAQDSELQSLSSDALTDDTMSYTDSSVDGREYAGYRNKMALRKQMKAIRRSIDTNQQMELMHHVIPRTQRVQPDCNLAERNPERFASMLTERLLKVKEETEKMERFMTSIRSIQETDDESNPSTSQLPRLPLSLPRSSTFNGSIGSSFPFTSMLLASAIANGDRVDEDNAQSILDDHVSHIWNSSGQTPSRSPGWLTPDHARRDVAAQMTTTTAAAFAPKSSKSNEPSQIGVSGAKFGAHVPPSSATHKHHQAPQHRGVGSGVREHRSREQDPTSAPSSSRWFPVPAPPQIIKGSLLTPASSSNVEETRHSAARMTHDGAGTSVDGVALGLSKTDATATTDKHLLPTTGATNERVLMWMLDNEKYRGARTRCSTDCSDKGSSSHKKSSHKSNNSKKNQKAGNRSESLDRSKTNNTVPATSDLIPGSQRAPEPQRRDVLSATAVVHQAPPSAAAVRSDENNRTDNSKSLLQKTSCLNSKTKTVIGERGEGSTTVVGYYFCDEPIPYRTTISGRNITLGHFKQLISKKGNYRYYFKKVCHDFESGVVHEEVTSDDDLLPLWDDKIVCKVERVN